MRTFFNYTVYFDLFVFLPPFSFWPIHRLMPVFRFRWHVPRYRLLYVHPHPQSHPASAVAHRRVLLVAFLVDLFGCRQTTLQRFYFHTCVHPSTPRARRYYWRTIAIDGELSTRRNDGSPKIRRPCCRPCFILCLHLGIGWPFLCFLLGIRRRLLCLLLGIRRSLLHHLPVFWQRLLHLLFAFCLCRLLLQL